MNHRSTQLSQALSLTICLIGLLGPGLHGLPALGESPTASAAGKAGEKAEEKAEEKAADTTAGAGRGGGLTMNGSSTEAARDLTLSDLRDSGLSLNQIRQQSINIFMEASRSECCQSSKEVLLVPTSISDKDVDAIAKCNPMAPRPQWLIFYVATIEPIIKLFVQDVHDTKAGVSQILVPSSSKEQLLPLWDEWTAGINGINSELTEINNLIDDGKAENAALAKHAKAMFDYTESLERTRQKAFIAIRQAEKHHADGGKVNLP